MRRSSIARKGGTRGDPVSRLEHGQNARLYRFDVRTDGRLTKQVSVTADMAVFRNQSVGIQEGPFLSGNKLTADLERGWEGEHELTAADVRAYADGQSTRRRPTRRYLQGAPPPARSTGRNAREVALAQLQNLMVANVFCTTQRLFLYGRLDTAERPGVGRHLRSIERSSLDLHPCR